MQHDVSQSTDLPLILAVDRNRRNLELLQQFLERAGFQTLIADSLEAVAQILAEPPPIKLALFDISGFDRQIWNHCEQLRSNHIPFLILAPRQSQAIQQESLLHGAQRTLVKPLVTKELLALIHNLVGEQA